MSRDSTRSDDIVARGDVEDGDGKVRRRVEIDYEDESNQPRENKSQVLLITPPVVTVVTVLLYRDLSPIPGGVTDKDGGTPRVVTSVEYRPRRCTP